jgi:predicted Zn-dependent protease
VLLVTVVACSPGPSAHRPGSPPPIDNVRIVDADPEALTEEQERRLGSYFDGYVIDGKHVLARDHPLTVAVEMIGARLVRVSDRPSLGYTFRVLNAPGWINAGATIGGFDQLSR